ncbi:nucleotide sugar dehydrogenase [Thermanaerothrix sp. 4228-RoL]|uniref:Nucleotide sugar dehydrogenase n=3 Tax=Thermanaerothrix TaxID=1077886 RepID=A0ABU3NN82_9CHLR|nr:nucleotide sugar dehydrogenase [Thermanaerothrix sp. 4228-RoL]MDT8897805.1 nucleotide sugar dehydrogenase [Thermanaerothrix sp. 4228-RoL]
MKFKKVCVLGLGYIGLPTASTLATHGLQVVGVDVNPQIVQGLQNGKLHLYEPGLRTLVQAALRSGNLVVQDTPEPADAFIIAVQTPFLEDKRADLRFVRAASEAIVPYLQRGNLVILESTSPPLTTRQVVAPILERSGLKAGRDFYLVYSPERVLPGQILRELIENARVVGGIDRASAEAARDLYATFVRGDIVLTDCTTAEMVKLMENTFRDVNIALANEFARLADRLGIDVWEAIALANRHPRVNILRPGPGVGGHCISVDPWFLVEVAPDLTRLIRAAREVNDSQPDFVVEWMERTLGRLEGRRVAVLGLAYKPDVDDLRESPAIEVALRLVQAGAQVRAFEPFKPEAQIPAVPTVTALADALQDAEILLLLVGHTRLRELNPEEVRTQTSARLVFDAVNGWDQTQWQKAGFQVWRLGVGRGDV